MSRRQMGWLMMGALIVAAAVQGARAQGDGDAARGIAGKATAEGAAMFDLRDAKGLSMTYTDDARLEVYSRESGGEGLKTEIRTGRADIQSYYENLFKSTITIHARNTVEHARLIEPGMLTISGVFEPNTESAEALKVPFIQVRTKQGESWKIVNLQLFIMPQK